MYSFNAAGVPAGAWDGLTAVVTSEELLKHISGLESGKSPGHDGITTDLLKLACVEVSGAPLPDGPVSSACIAALLTFVNTTIRVGLVPKFLKEGVIVMVPKPGGGPTVADMRPITLLPRSENSPPVSLLPESWLSSTCTET